MSDVLLANILYVFVSISWIIYLVQELFISGSSSLNVSLSKTEEERKQIQVATGIHWDGIEVWLLAAVTVTFGAFPLVFATIFSHMYVVFFLLLYALIGRGISIEVIYKLDNKKWVKTMVITWMVSSILILFILGMYISNILLGVTMDDGGFTKGFISLFNVTSISAGLLFVTLGFTAGAGWISLTTAGDIAQRAVAFVKKVGVVYMVPVLLLLVLMGLNQNATSIFIGELFSKSPLFFILPILTVAGAIMVTISGYRTKGKELYIFSLITMAMFLITGFVGIYPYMLPSRLMFEYGISIEDAMVSTKALKLIFYAVIIFYPIVISYQTWKYIRFTKKVKPNDE